MGIAMGPGGTRRPSAAAPESSSSSSKLMKVVAGAGIFGTAVVAAVQVKRKADRNAAADKAAESLCSAGKPVLVKVKPGDTLWTLCEKHSSCPLDETLLNATLKQNNMKSKQDFIYPGDKLLIPTSGGISS